MLVSFNRFKILNKIFNIITVNNSDIQWNIFFFS